MRNNPEERESINNWWKRRAAWACIGLATWLGSAEAEQYVSEPKDHSNNIRAVLDTTEWIGKGLAGFNGISLIFGGLAVELSYKTNQKDKQKLIMLKKRLPQIGFLNPLNAALNIEKGGSSDSLAVLKQLLLYNNPSNLSIYEEIDYVATNLAEKLHSGLASRNDMDGGYAITEVVLAAAILDSSLPIDPDCPVTPWTEDVETTSHKFWFDFILKREQELYPDPRLFAT